jgi:hypothetical protein
MDEGLGFNHNQDCDPAAKLPGNRFCRLPEIFALAKCSHKLL